MSRAPGICEVAAVLVMGGVSWAQAPQGAAVASPEPVAELIPQNDSMLRFVPYLWATNLEADLSLGRMSGEVDVSFIDLLKGTDTI